MAILEAINENQHRVEDLREQLDKVRHALDNTDAVLGVADEGLIIAEDVIEEARRAMPAIIAVTIALTATAATIYFLRKRKERQNS